jgi:Mannosyl-glycoprotein endo-beta-N-acetylglucosaminidase
MIEGMSFKGWEPIVKYVPKVQSQGNTQGSKYQSSDLDTGWYDEKKLQNFIDEKTGGKAPVNAADFTKVAKETGVPIDLMVAQAVQESNFGTLGRATQTNNIFNVGNVDAGDNANAKNDGNSKFQSNWVKGMFDYANLIKNEYANNPNDVKTEDILNNDFYRPKLGGRYATDPNYTKNVAAIAKTVIGRIKL